MSSPLETEAAAVLQLDQAETDVPGVPALPGATDIKLLPGPVGAALTARTARKTMNGDSDLAGLATRVAEAEALLTKYSKENERLAGQNTELRQRRQFVDQDYTGAPCAALCGC